MLCVSIKILSHTSAKRKTKMLTVSNISHVKLYVSLSNDSMGAKGLRKQGDNYAVTVTLTAQFAPLPCLF